MGKWQPTVTSISLMRTLLPALYQKSADKAGPLSYSTLPVISLFLQDSNWHMDHLLSSSQFPQHREKEQSTLENKCAGWLNLLSLKGRRWPKLKTKHSGGVSFPHDLYLMHSSLFLTWEVVASSLQKYGWVTLVNLLQTLGTMHNGIYELKQD